MCIQNNPVVHAQYEGDDDKDRHSDSQLMDRVGRENQNAQYDNHQDWQELGKGKEEVSVAH